MLEFKDLTPAGVMTSLGTMQPTSGFGELFQYSNQMAAAAGYLGGGHVANPQMASSSSANKATSAR